MKFLKAVVFTPFILLGIFMLVSPSLAQEEDSLDCYFSEYSSNLSLPESIPILQDTSLRVAILFVQFADWQTEMRPRATVGFGE